MAGLPPTVVRRYDSRASDWRNFGVGCRLDVQSVRLLVGGVAGASWQVAVYTPRALRPIGDARLVTLTPRPVECIPEGALQVFRLPGRLGGQLRYRPAVLAGPRRFLRYIAVSRHTTAA
jgi:hypothetical protein